MSDPKPDDTAPAATATSMLTPEQQPALPLTEAPVVLNKDGSVRKKMGRPRVEIDWDSLDKLCEMQCTEVEIARFFKCGIDAINSACKREKGKTFREYRDEVGVSGLVSLRRAQFTTALNGNPSMQIWLGKQLLGQKDQSKTEHTGAGGGPIQVDMAAIERKLERLGSGDIEPKQLEQGPVVEAGEGETKGWIRE